MKRSLSDSNIILGSEIPTAQQDSELLHEESQNKGLVELLPEVSTYCRYACIVLFSPYKFQFSIPFLSIQISILLKILIRIFDQINQTKVYRNRYNIS